MADRSAHPISPTDSGLFALFGAVIALIVLFFTHGGVAPAWYGLPVVFGLAGYCGAMVWNRRGRN